MSNRTSSTDGLASSLRVRTSAGDPGVTVALNGELELVVWIAAPLADDPVLLILRRQRLARRVGLPSELLDHQHRLNFEP